MRIFWLILLWPLLAGATEPSAAPTPVPPHVQRIAEAARLWARIQWVHPGLADGRVDWDRALLDALPSMAAAGSDAAWAEALRRLLEPLHDSAVRIGPGSPLTDMQAPAGPPRAETIGKGVVLVSMHRPLSSWDRRFPEVLAGLRAALAPARAAIFDLRAAEAGWDGPADLVDPLLADFIEQPLVLPAVRGRAFQGYPPQAGSSSGGYFTGWLTQAAVTLRPAAGSRQRRLAFILDEATIVPPAVLALQKAGQAYIVTEGKPNAAWFAPTQELIVGGIPVRIAGGELVFEDGRTGFGADRSLPVSRQVGPASPAVRVADALLASRQRPGAGIAWRALAPLAQWRPDKTHADAGLPDLPLRRLAVIRLWSVIDAFFPYKDLLDRPWAEALPEFLLRMESVADERGYALALAEMAARLHDNHVRVRGASLERALGEAGLPLHLSVVEGRVVVSEALDAAGAAATQPWDEVVAIDAEPVKELMSRLEPHVSWANPGTRDRNLARLLGRGADGSIALLQMQGADGRPYQASLPRSRVHANAAPPKRTHDIVRILPGNIGYADLDRLQPEDVDAMFERLMDTRAIVFDMRGYPNGTAWPIAPRLNVKGATRGPLFEPPLLLAAGGWDEPGRGTWYQSLPQGDGKPLYRGRVLMLIDARTQSQAEHTGLFFETACDVVYVGSPSAGSNGDVTNLVLPGGLTMSFSGQGVRRPDGRQLQRVGLVPEVPVRPSLAGLRAGRDEVLEAAIAFVLSGR